MHIAGIVLIIILVLIAIFSICLAVMGIGFVAITMTQSALLDLKIRAENKFTPHKRSD